MNLEWQVDGRSDRRVKNNKTLHFLVEDGDITMDSFLWKMHITWF